MPQPLTLEAGSAAVDLLDEPLALRVRGADAGAELRWRARYRDDDGRVWRAEAGEAEALASGFTAGGAPIAALRSLRPVDVDVRVEAPDGRAATRTVRRLLVADGVRSRRWRDLVAAVLHRPAAEPCATLVLDATASGEPADVAALAGPLLASRGVLVLVVGSPRRGTTREEAIEEATRLLAAVPGAGEPRLLAAADLPIPPGVGVGDDGLEAASDRDQLWDALIAELGARPRTA